MFADEHKDQAYEEVHIEKINFFAKNGNVGFFSPYKSWGDVQNQVKAPLIMPLVCVAEAAKHLLDTLKNIGLTLVNLAVLDINNANKSIQQACFDLIIGVYYTLSALFDTAHSLVAFATRTATTLISRVIGGVVAFGEAVTAPEETAPSSRY